MFSFFWSNQISWLFVINQVPCVSSCWGGLGEDTHPWSATKVGNTIRHRGEAVLRKHLRTFEENQRSNIIRRTKNQKTLKFHQFYSAKNTRRDTHNSRKPFFPNSKQQKTHLSQRKTLKNRKLRKNFLENIFDGLR